MTEKRKNGMKPASATGAIASSIGESLTGIKTVLAVGNFVVDAMRANRIQQATHWLGGMPLIGCKK